MSHSLTAEESVPLRTRLAVTAAIWWIPGLIILIAAPGHDSYPQALLAAPLMYFGTWLARMFFGSLPIPLPLALLQIVGPLILTPTMVFGKWRSNAFFFQSVVLGLFMVIYLCLLLGSASHSTPYIGP